MAEEEDLEKCREITSTFHDLMYSLICDSLDRTSAVYDRGVKEHTFLHCPRCSDPLPLVNAVKTFSDQVKIACPETWGCGNQDIVNLYSLDSNEEWKDEFARTVEKYHPLMQNGWQKIAITLIIAGEVCFLHILLDKNYERARDYYYLCLGYLVDKSHLLFLMSNGGWDHFHTNLGDYVPLTPQTTWCQTRYAMEHGLPTNKNRRKKE